MNKKRYLIIIAIVIFGFLTLFTFANPLNNGEETDNRVLEEIEEDDVIEQEKEEIEKDEEKEIVEIKPVVVPQYNNHGVTIDKLEKEEDKSYDLAFEAVKKVEKTLSEEDLLEASKLVEKVTDKNKQEYLEDRLSFVLEIIDLNDVVDTLVDDVNSAKSKEDMDSARDYMLKNNLTKRLNGLSNKVIKELLIEKLDTVIDLLEDKTAPTINIEDGAILDSETKIIVTDDNEVTIILNDEEIANNEVVDNGVYKLTTTDSSFNTKTINFIVDTLAPVIKVTYANGMTYINGEDVTELEFKVYKDDELKYSYNSEENESIKSFKLTTTELAAGKYIIKATDKFGRETKVDTYIAEDLKTAFNYTDVITLHEDVELIETLKITSGQNKVIDLNGNKITGQSTEASASTLINVEKGSSLKLTGDGEVSFTAGNPDTNWGTSGPKPYPGYANNTISNSGKLIIDGPTIINNTQKGGASYVIDNYAGAELEVNSGTITQAGGDVAIRLFTNSATVPINVTINGGTITGYRAIWIQLSSNNAAVAPLINLTINGGTLVSSDTVYNDAIYSYSYGNSFVNTNVTITNGTFDGSVSFGGGYKGDTENVTITGGTFNGYLGRYTSTGWVDFEQNW